MSDPTPEEQLLLELINRARADPEGEASRLAGVAANIDGAALYFAVDYDAFVAAMAGFVPVQPLAWNSKLSIAAAGHNAAMIAADTQSHQLPGEAGVALRAINAGYTGFTALTENIYAYADDPLFGHAGSIIDWGFDAEDYAGATLLADFTARGDGMQDPAGHRITTLNSAYDEVGLSITADASSASQVGPLVITQMFGSRAAYAAQFVGSVIDDADLDDFYDIGEGMGGVSVSLRAASGALYSTTTWASGGYQIAVPAGSYTITFSGGGLNAPVVVVASIGADNVYVSVQNPAEAVRHDFNGDGRGDVLWRHASGLVTQWQSAGATLTPGSAPHVPVGLDWAIAGTGDFNADARADVLWRHASGLLTIWHGSISGFEPSSILESAGKDWQVAGTGDFNADGRDDILWRHTSGAVTNWLADGADFSPNAAFFANPGTDWRVAGAGDFNRDGANDILWRHTSGAVTTWLASGVGFVASSTFLANPGADWRVTGIGDFNADGMDDILWRHTSGAITNWLANATGFASNAAFLANVGTDWVVVGTQDITGDGAADILWRNANGALTFWEATGNGFDMAQPIYAVGTDWQVAGLI